MQGAGGVENQGFGVDWAQPWLASWRGHGLAAEAGLARGLSVAEALNGAAATSPVRFVVQAVLPAGVAYESFIFESRSVPTRDNLHDFFNGLCWQRFPAIKTRLNQLQAAEIAAQGVQPQRGPVRDALTLFDENAALLIAPEPLWQALAARDWRRLFVDLRSLWAEAELLLFGHALLEKLVSPRKAITAHVYRPRPAIDSVANLDAAIAADLDTDWLATKPFYPLPVLGVPGWWRGNEDVCFYDDPLVFRPSRVSTTNTTNDAA